MGARRVPAALLEVVMAAAEIPHSDVFVIGAGPAGLTSSYLLTKRGVSTTVIEADPVYVGGISRTANYKNFDFTAYISGTYGNQLFNFVKYFSHFNAFQRNRAKDFLYEAGKTLPKLDGGDNYSSQRSSYFVEDGSFTRLRNLLIGYSLPASALSRVGFSRARVYIQGQNLFTIAKYSGLDPDVTVSNITEGYNSQRDLSLGVDYGRYPLPRTVIVGINLEF